MLILLDPSDGLREEIYWYIWSTLQALAGLAPLALIAYTGAKCVGSDRNSLHEIKQILRGRKGRIAAMIWLLLVTVLVARWVVMAD